MDRGYSCSPLAYKNTIILTLGGGQNQTLIAFNQKDGTIAWKNQSLDMSPSSPIIINVDGQEQLVAFSARSSPVSIRITALALESPARHRMGTEYYDARRGNDVPVHLVCLQR